jgi:ubiquinol-cytochrome c reductase cytochrome b subunit
VAVAGGAVLAAALMTIPAIRFDPKLWGVILMALSVTIFFGLPWLDQSPVKSMRYRPRWHMALVLIFVVAFVVLGWLGMNPPTPLRTSVAQVCTACYFGFFLLMPWWSRAGTFKPVPARVTFTPH